MALKDNNGDWIYDHQAICQHTQNYFQSLFKTENNFSKILPHDPPLRQELDLLFLEQVPTDAEVHTPVKAFQPYKSPGPDGLHSIFYQKYCQIVRKSLSKICQQAFLEGCIPEEINKALVCLIPKSPEAACLTQFRPISLCNISYKTIAKIIATRLIAQIIATRLRHIMNHLVGPSRLVS